MTRVFKSYDKNGDGKITFEEWLAMKEGATDDPARRAREQQQFSAVDSNDDGSLSLEEVLSWRAPGREGD
jgi:Ca2+-binding EF-hand superfamily protein